MVIDFVIFKYTNLKKYEITILKLNKKVTKQRGLGVSSKTVF